MTINANSGRIPLKPPVRLAVLVLAAAITAWALFALAAAPPAVAASPLPVCPKAGVLNISTGQPLVFNQWGGAQGGAPVSLPFTGWVAPPPPPGYPVPSGSLWINPTGIGSDVFGAGPFEYHADFIVPEPTEVMLDFWYAADDDVFFTFAELGFIGPLQPIASGAGPGVLQHSITVFPAVAAGVYRLTATVNNNVSNTPSGLLVAGTVSCAPVCPSAGVLTMSTGTAGIGSADPRWELKPDPLGGLGLGFGVAPSTIPAWVAPPVDTPQPYWIHKSNNGSGSTAENAGTYIYQASFRVPSVPVIQSFTLDFVFAADNEVDFSFDTPNVPDPFGVGVPGAGYGTLKPLGWTMTNPLPGLYTLTARVTNESGSPTPSGLLVHGDVTCVLGGGGGRVGGTVELLGQPDAPGSTEASASSSVPYAALAGGMAAGVLALAAGGWYVRRRWLR